MYGLTLALIFCLFLLALFKHLKVLYDSIRKVRIVEQLDNTDGIRTKRIVIRKYSQAPGPLYIWPILGNIVDVGKYGEPTIAFNELAKQYGNIYSMTLGTTKVRIDFGFLRIRNSYQLI